MENALMKLLPRLTVALFALGIAWIFGPIHQVEGEANPAPATRAEISYNRDVRPILSNRCFKCHGPDLKKGGLNLRERDIAVKEAIVPGKSAESLLIERITAEDAIRAYTRGSAYATFADARVGTLDGIEKFRKP